MVRRFIALSGRKAKCRDVHGKFAIVTQPPPAPTPWWRANLHRDKRPLLLARNRIQSALRTKFASQAFVEVDPAILQVSPGNEAHLHAFATSYRNESSAMATPFYLHTSPEFACKKLLAAGEERIVTFAKVFRNREVGPLHHPEFTMLEWYRAREDYEAVMADCVDILRIAGSVIGRVDWSWRGRACTITAAPERLTVHAAFARHAGIDLDRCFAGSAVDLFAMRTAVERAGIRVTSDDTWSDLFSRVLAERIEPNLGIARPTVLYEYPTHEAALARACPHDPRLAQRFELYVCGVELANAFGELTDPAEQRRRFELEMQEKERVYGERYPIDADFLAALAHMPEAAGAALGFDRLVMLATGADRIDQVVWTPLALPFS
jgi:lysyl-tRNA synthetase class 2